LGEKKKGGNAFLFPGEYNRRKGKRKRSTNSQIPEGLKEKGRVGSSTLRRRIRRGREGRKKGRCVNSAANLAQKKKRGRRNALF